MDMVRRYDVHWVQLDPTRGSEIAKTRPCVIVSPDDINDYLSTVIIIPLTSTLRNYPYRTRCHIDGKDGDIAVDQIRTVDKSRIKGRLGTLSATEIEALKDILNQMFCL